MIGEAKASLVLSALLLLSAVAQSRSTGPQSSDGSQETTSPDLNGKWKTEDGRQVIIENIGFHVHATFVGANNKCPNGGTMDYLLDGDLKGASLSGTMTACTRDPKLVIDCGLPKVWTTTFDATAGPDKISGKVFIMGIAGGTESGHYVNCHTDRRFDKHQDFTLVRVECGPEAWANFYRKTLTADELIVAWIKRGQETDEEFKEHILESVWGTSKATAIHIGIDTDAEKVAEAFEEDFWDRAARLESLLKADAEVATVKGATTAAEKAATLAFIAELALEATMVGESFQQRVDSDRANDKDLERADALWRSALDDLRRALSPSPECKHDREKAKVEESLEDKAHALMDKWEIDGRDLYMDPSGAILNSAAAFKKAKEILTTHQSGRLWEHPKFEPAGFHQVAASQEVTVTVGQLGEAIAQIQSAKFFWKKGMDMIVAGIVEQKNFRYSLKKLRGAQPVATR